MREGGGAAGDDEGGARDLQEEVETVNTGHQQADEDTNHCGDQSATQHQSISPSQPQKFRITFSC